MNNSQPPQNRSVLNKIFLSPNEPRLRAGWRLLLQTIFLLFLGGCLSVLLVIFLLIVRSPLRITPAGITPEVMLLGVIAEVFAVTFSVFLARRFLDKRSIESLGLKLNTWTLIDILAGILITLLQMGLIYLIMSWLGWTTFQGFAWQFDPIGLILKNTLLFFVIFILVGWSEELLCRGYQLQTIASGTNLFWGVLLSSAIFGVLHIFNPGANWASTLGIFLAGLFFAYAYIRTRQLWLPIGMHLGWNFFEGVVFGFPVSGLDIYPLMRIRVQGPELWTGGVFGPEAGLIVIPALLVGVLLVHLYSRVRKGQNEPGLES
jgi:membrane protease YdiL (CAAX protease family)